MTRQNNSRLATTAIAALLAFSSPPLVAQDTQPPPEPVAETPVTVTPDPLAPEPVAAETPPAAETTAETPAESETAEAADPEPAATATPVARRSPASTRPANRVARSAAPAAASPIAAPAEAPITAPVEPMAPEAIAPDPFAEPPVATSEPTETAISDDVLPIASAAGLGLLALAGAAMALRRRRRRREEEAEWAMTEAKAEPVMAEEPAPAMRPEPVFLRQPAPIHDPVPSEATATALPAGFDVSRFGRHVQEAYRGPTPDNPSLSLKNRLRRAAFFDQQERRTGTAAPEPAAAEAPATGWALRKDDEFMFRRAGTTPLRPAFHN